MSIGVGGGGGGGWGGVFFFQAEDGIRDYKVTGVQTCALPIWPDAFTYPECLMSRKHCILGNRECQPVLNCFELFSVLD